MRTASGVVRLAAVLVPVVLAIGGCGPFAAGTAAPTGSVLIPSASPPGSAGGSPPPAATPASSAGSAGSGTGLAVDASLLHVLPAQVAGVPLEADPATAAQIAADPTVAESARAIAVALAIRPGSSTADDLAIVSVIRLRPGVFSDAWFANWRATYDQGACAVAGGVKGQPSRASIAGRTVFVGTCAGDAQTYHVQLADPTLIVSITAAGPAHFGELVVGGLAQ
ncbi:MAG: hypothetical protein HY262_03420 [Chloroflexi bacterium]|nr:hypothetical protein [Chloroflexota bacterium]